MEAHQVQPVGANCGSSDYSSLSELSRTPTIHDNTTAVSCTEGDKRQAAPVIPEQPVTAVEAQPTAAPISVEVITTTDRIQALGLLEFSASVPDFRSGPVVGVHQNYEELSKQLAGESRSFDGSENVQPDSIYTAMVVERSKGASHKASDRALKQATVVSNATLTLSPRESNQLVSSSFAMPSLADCSDLSSFASVVLSEATTPANVTESPKNPAPASLPTTPNTPCTPSLASSPERLSQQLEKPSHADTSLASPLMPSLLPFHHPLPAKSHPKIKPKASIPPNLTTLEYARQCVAAAESSRLNPYALQEEEYVLLRQHISHAQIITYLNIRNAILRLWLRKPDRAVTRNEAIGCAKEARWFDAASFCFDWLVRRGYINFGCVQFKNQGPQKRPQQNEEGIGALGMYGAGVVAHGNLEAPTRTAQVKRRRRIVVIGAGMAGLGCARQLDNLIRQYHNLLGELGEDPPEVLVLEGRNRIGGRIYSRAFHARPQYASSGFDQKRYTAEMGGMIITGFDRGNPMNVLVRGQLGLGYHTLLSTTDLYDINGQRVDIVRDNMVEKLFNECLDRVSEYKFKLPIPKTVEVDHELVDEGRDSSSDGYRSIAAAENKAAAKKAAANATKAISTLTFSAPTKTKSVPPSATSTTPRGEIFVKDDQGPTAQTAAQKLRQMGWSLRPGVTETRDLDLDQAAAKPGATLGYVVEEAIKQYRELVELNAQDLRLLNWHVANLEYGNAINQDFLSLKGWDIDAGNEWEGKHSIVQGGYQSVARGLMLCPSSLDVQRQRVVKKIIYGCSAGSSNTTNRSDESLPVKIECDGGHTFEADCVVNTIPLGVLKSGAVEFDPPLPESKANAIARLGYGVLNKIILLYRRVFWDPERDIFGVLRAPTNLFSLDQREYSRRRGRMFQWFNVSEATGMPCLVALMAGDAAYDAERLSNDELVAEATAVLRSVFGAQNVPAPTEAFVTRWASDEFSCGSYSSAGPDMGIDDYSVMARPVGKTLFFAGEHTIGTHPATVHGAYLSGLRAASEVFDELVGPIHASTPLVASREATVPLAVKRKTAPEDDSGASRVGRIGGGGSEENSGNMNVGTAYRVAKARNRQQVETYEMRVQEYVHSQIGRRPETPPRVVDTSYLLFSRAKYEIARRRCEERRRPRQGRPLPNEVRVLTSKMWRSASAEERRPYAEQAMAQKQAYEVALREHSVKAAAWDRLAADMQAEYEKEHPDRGRPGATGGSGTYAAPSSSDAVPAQRSPFGGWRLRQKASYQDDGASHMYMAAGEKT